MNYAHGCDQNRSNRIPYIRLIFFSLIIFLSYGLYGCSGSMEPIDGNQNFEWRFSTPAAQGFNAGEIAKIVTEFGHYEYTYSLLIMRNGYLVVEAYYNGQNPDKTQHVHSVSKSFTSALVGIALREGFFSSLDQKMIDFLPEYQSEIDDPRKYDITLEHLITMRSGLDWDETEANWIEYAGSPDWIEYAINLPLKFDPGKGFDYSSPQTNLLSVILTRAAGVSAMQFAEKYLFTPLQISIDYWYQDPQGYYTGGHGMHFTSRALAKFGYLYLNSGRLNGKQFVPAEWISRSIQNYSGTGASGYGYGWWTDLMDGYPVYMARGRGGQFILVVPALKSVIVATTNVESWETSAQQARMVYGILERIILADIAG